MDAARRRGSVLLTTNHRDFRRGYEVLRGYPGVIVLVPLHNTGINDLEVGVENAFDVLRMYRQEHACSPGEAMYERCLVITPEVVYFESVDGMRVEVWPAWGEWVRSPAKERRW